MIDEEFYALWQNQVTASSPMDIAVRGGEIADDPATIFIAGYQAAIAATFPELKTGRWYSFAVSEDRSPDSTRPGVTLSEERLSGFKTWIAAVDCVDALVVKVGSGVGAKYGVVERDDPGLVLSAKPQPGFLPAMSQGMAEFANTPVQWLEDSSGVGGFHKNEPFYIYIALLSQLTTQNNELAHQAKRVLEEQRTQQNLTQLDLAVQDVLKSMERVGLELGDHWSVDQRLFTMYSKNIQKAA